MPTQAIVMEDLGFSEAEYGEYLKNRSTLHNDVAREDPNTSIFDAMGDVEKDFSEKVYGGLSINDMFKKLR